MFGKAGSVFASPSRSAPRAKPESADDPSAPSKPNTFGLPAGRLLKSLTSALEYYPMAIETDPTEYSDFTLEAQFKSAGGRFDCSGGLIFRYVDDKNFYLLSAGCPSDYFALSRMTNGALVGLKQSVVPTDKTKCRSFSPGEFIMSIKLL